MKLTSYRAQQKQASVQEQPAAPAQPTQVRSPVKATPTPAPAPQPPTVTIITVAPQPTVQPEPEVSGPIRISTSEDRITNICLKNPKILEHLSTQVQSS